MRRLDELQGETRANPSFTRSRPGRSITFADFELLTPGEFYVAWYEPATSISFDGDALQLQLTINEDLTLCLWPGDKVSEHKWVLCWKTTDGGKTATGDLHWIFIDGIAPNGVKVVDQDETVYTTLLYQRKNLPGRASDQPFRLDDAIGRAFKACLENDKQLAKRMRSDRLDMSPKVLPQLLASMRSTSALPQTEENAPKRPSSPVSVAARLPHPPPRYCAL
jgi:hypothetical protein